MIPSIPSGQSATTSPNSTVVGLGSAARGAVGVVVTTSGYFILGIGLAVALIASYLLILRGSGSLA